MTLAASPSNITSPNRFVPCCAGLEGGYAFGGFYEPESKLTKSNDKYIKKIIDLLVPNGDTPTERGTKDLAYFEDLGQVTVLLEWIMNPPGSTTLTYAQCVEALGYLVEVLEADIFEPRSIEFAVLLHISVGEDIKILAHVLEEQGRVFAAYAGDNLLLSFDLFQTRPISRTGALASLAAAKAEYAQYSPMAIVPESFEQTIIQGEVRYKMWMELDDGEPQWPRFTYGDLLLVVGTVQLILQGGAIPSADKWDALYAKITTSETKIDVRFVHVEPIIPGTNLLTSENSTQPSISGLRNSSVVPQVDVT